MFVLFVRSLYASCLRMCLSVSAKRERVPAYPHALATLVVWIEELMLKTFQLDSKNGGGG